MSPFQAIWQDGLLRPLNRFHNVLAAEFGEGEVITLVREEPESVKSRSHYFVCIHEAWASLPEDLAERFPSEDHLRKYALIRAGYRDERSIACASKAEAQRVAAFVKPLDTYAVVVVREAVVTVLTAQTQKLGAMGKQRFQESKDAVLNIIAGLLDVEPATLAKVRQAA